MTADINSDISIQNAALEADKKTAREDALSDNAQIGIKSDSLFSDKTFAQQVEEDMARQNAIIDEELRQRDAIFREEGIGFAPDAVPEGNEEDLLGQIETEGELLEHVPEYNDAGSPLDEFSPDELLKLHLSRSRQAQAIDNQSRNKNIATDQNGYRNWVRNPGKSGLQVPAFFVGTGGAAPIHVTDQSRYTCFDWSSAGKMTSIDVNWFSPSTIPLVGIQTRGERALYSESKPEVQWAAVASQYFCTIVTSQEPAASVWAKRFDTKKQNNSPVFGIQGAVGLAGFPVAPGATVTKKFEIYAGPKELSRLRKIGGNQDAVLNFGMFGFISEFLLWAMNTLHGWLGSYAAAIIVLTLIIKSGLWPIQNKATNEMRKMSSLAPKMTELKEKYKDDPQKMNEETMKLYREYGVNPFSGCIPMFIQIPIFFGFYSMLGSAIELRSSSFFWITDLSQPDTVGHILGFPINLLPLIMSLTMVWQMVITPKSGDAAQQRILYFMPVIFLTFAYNYASGLALYWTTQNIFSIVQLYLTRNRPLPTLEKKSVIAKREAAKNPKKKKRL